MTILDLMNHTAGFEDKVIGLFSQEPESVLPLSELASVLQGHRDAGRTIVHCHGVFDLLHIGHIRYLEQARSFGDIEAVKGVSFDIQEGPKGPAAARQITSGALAPMSSR